MNSEDKRKELEAELEDEIVQPDDLKVLCPEPRLFKLGGNYINEETIEVRSYKVYPPKLFQMASIEKLSRIINGNEGVDDHINTVMEIFMEYLEEPDKKYIQNTVGLEQISEFITMVGELNREGFLYGGFKVSKKKI